MGIGGIDPCNLNLDTGNKWVVKFASQSLFSFLYPLESSGIMSEFQSPSGVSEQNKYTYLCSELNLISWGVQSAALSLYDWAVP